MLNIAFYPQLSCGWWSIRCFRSGVMIGSRIPEHTRTPKSTSSGCKQKIFIISRASWYGSSMSWYKVEMGDVPPAWRGIEVVGLCPIPWIVWEKLITSEYVQRPVTDIKEEKSWSSTPSMPILPTVVHILCQKRLLLPNSSNVYVSVPFALPIWGE